MRRLLFLAAAVAVLLALALLGVLLEPVRRRRLRPV